MEALNLIFIHVQLFKTFIKILSLQYLTWSYREKTLVNFTVSQIFKHKCFSFLFDFDICDINFLFLLFQVRLFLNFKISGQGSVLPEEIDHR